MGRQVNCGIRNFLPVLVLLSTVGLDAHAQTTSQKLPVITEAGGKIRVATKDPRPLP